jgi:FkbM family methyltransferase
MVGRRVRTYIRSIVREVALGQVECVCRKERLGSAYGGWEVAVDYLGATGAVFSCGIGEDISFDRELIDRFPVVVHGFDPTPRSIEWIRRQTTPARFVFHEYGIAGYDGDASFFPPENQAHVSHTMLAQRSAVSAAIVRPVKRIGTVMRELGCSHISILKMDIEGSEYQVIEDLARSDIRPAQILVEFHHRMRRAGLLSTRTSIRRLRQIGYRLFSISATGDEFAFLHASADRLISAPRQPLARRA